MRRNVAKCNCQCSRMVGKHKYRHITSIVTVTTASNRDKQKQKQTVNSNCFDFAKMKPTKKVETQLQDISSDVISSMQFAPQSNQYLAISSWDGSVRLFDIQNPTKCRQKFSYETPVLDIAFTVSALANT